VASSKQQAAVVFNPIKVDIDALRRTVAAAEEKAGWGPTLWFETTQDDPGTGQAREAVKQGADVVMAAGGDGTVRAVAEGIHTSTAALALLPSGTGNLLARNLDLTLDNMEHSVETAFMGKDRAIDLGLMEAERPGGKRDRYVFLVMAGVGLDAQMIANTNDSLKAKVGWIAYVDAIVRSLRGNNRVRMRFSVDGSPVRTISAHTVLVGNCGSLPGNILLLPEAAVDDGIFDVVALRPKGFIGWVQIWVKIVWENGVLRRTQVGRKMLSLTKEVRTLRYMKGARFVARLSRPEEFELDGDGFGTAIALRAVVDPLGLTIRVPADED
jgi:diacylglycerol kinase (ATP)